jgi:hypothetical protein
MILSLELLLEGSVSLIAFIALVVGVYRSTAFATGAVMLVFLWEAAVVSLPPLIVVPLHVYPQDLLFFALLIASAARLGIRQNRPTLSKAHGALVVLGALTAISAARGVPMFGLETAGVEVRGYFYFLAGAFYFSIPRSRESLLASKSMGIWLGTCAALLVLAAARWGGLMMVPDGWEVAGGSFTRVLVASQALFLAEVLFLGLLLGSELPMPFVWRGLPFVLIPSLLLLQHRSVWAVILVCALLSWLVLGNVRRVVAVAGVTLASVFVTALALVVERSSDIVASLGSSVDEAFRSDNSTLIWRIEGWQALLSGSYLGSSIDYLLGQPFGSGYVRYVRGVVVDVDPHNFFVVTFLRQGGLGLAILVSLYAAILYQLRSDSFDRRRDLHHLLALLLVGQLVFFVPYSPDYVQGIILGWALAAAARRGTLPRLEPRAVASSGSANGVVTGRVGPLVGAGRSG